MRYFLNTISLVYLFILFLSLTSCSTNKNVTYFKDFADTAKKTSVLLANFNYPRIQTDDILNITIQTIDPTTNTLLNAPNTFTPAAIAGSINSGGQQSAVPGYLVDQNGEIELPFTGKVKVIGLTTVEAKELIRQKMVAYVKEPIVNVKFANFKVTVIGEVTRPGTYIIPNEKVSILDALGLAGDLTIYGKRENILLLRDTINNVKNLVHLDLNSKDVISSPYYYLQSNDVIYVEPNKAKINNSDATRNRNITLIASGLSVLIVLFSRVKF
ncbi:hypothetical protein FC093_13950 [Ilyomonas limi]|uniref:Polysaccharide export protein n=1 Tax=Ilyomonas limi TaxID=2575867 RepID=A0A4U3KY49_9BACT|nr:polysaccharide biosynthesis/export family protein [Ilyomonas limi]TKK67400.1 hypothetical protein FC093_13950 [Ilyomonas limi]